MPNFVKDLHDKSESLKGAKLIAVLTSVIVLFGLIGITAGYFIPRLLIKNEGEININLEDLDTVESSQYEGKVVYVDPNFYPLDGISFYLEDSNGEEIILLKAKDEKLTVVEGLNVLLFGTVEKTKDGKENVLMVEKVVVSNR